MTDRFGIEVLYRLASSLAAARGRICQETTGWMGDSCREHKSLENQDNPRLNKQEGLKWYVSLIQKIIELKPKKGEGGT